MNTTREKQRERTQRTKKTGKDRAIEREKNKVVETRARIYTFEIDRNEWNSVYLMNEKRCELNRNEIANEEKKLMTKKKKKKISREFLFTLSTQIRAAKSSIALLFSVMCHWILPSIVIDLKLIFFSFVFNLTFGDDEIRFYCRIHFNVTLIFGCI